MKRIAKSTEMTREEWLDFRKKGIGASDAAAAIGISKYKSQVELYLEKTGQYQIEFSEEAQERMDMGLAIEEFISQRYQEKTGLLSAANHSSRE